MRPFEIRHVLICEDVRPEAGGKLAILGFLGFPPDLEIGVPKLGQVMGKLVVLVFFGGEPGSYEISGEIVSPANKRIPISMIREIELIEGRASGAVVHLPNMVFHEVGEHRLVFHYQSKVLLNTTFTIRIEPALQLQAI